jgi:hypothetical protein
VAAYEASGASDEDRIAVLATRLSGVSDLALPVHPTPGGMKVLRRSIDKALKAEVGGSESDQEEGPQEHGGGGGEAAVKLSAHGVGPLDLDLARSRREELIF